MTHKKNDTQERNESQETFEAMLREKLQQAVRTALVSVLEAEGVSNAGIRAVSSPQGQSGSGHWGDVCRGSEYGEGGRSGRSLNRQQAQRVDRFTCVPPGRERVRPVEDAPTGSALRLCLC